MTESIKRFTFSAASDISGNGRFFVYRGEAPDGGQQLVRHDLYNGDSFSFAADTIVTPGLASISGDGRFVAYSLNLTGSLIRNSFEDLESGRTTTLGETVRGGVTAISSDGSAVVAYSQDMFSPNSYTSYYNTTTGATLSIGGRAIDVSSDGRFVVTYQFGVDSDDSGSQQGIYRYDVITSDRVLVSSNAAGMQADGSGGSISANGRLIAFVSSSTNLIENDTNEASDVFVKDLDTGLVYLASAGAEQANGNSFEATISGNGRYVVFVSEASNLVANDTNGIADVFRKDLWTGDIELVSKAIAGGAANGTSERVSISDDGRYIKFSSEASNLIADDTNDAADFFVVDMGIEPDEPRVSSDDLLAAFQRVTVTDPGSTKAQAETITLQDGSIVANPLYMEVAQLDELIDLYQSSFVPVEQVQEKIIEFASDTTAVAVQTYQFFTGQTPGVEGLSYLIDSSLNQNDLTDAYYAKFSEDNRYINFAVNLGKWGEGKEDFAQDYGQLTFDEAIRKAYDVIIGSEIAEAAGLNPEEAYAYVKSQQRYFLDIGDGDTGAKAAMAGYLMYEGFRASLGHFAEATEAYLHVLYLGDELDEADTPMTYYPSNDINLTTTGYADIVGVSDIVA